MSPSPHFTRHSSSVSQSVSIQNKLVSCSLFSVTPIPCDFCPGHLGSPESLSPFFSSLVPNLVSPEFVLLLFILSFHLLGHACLCLLHLTSGASGPTLI
jgi:hypothetical protein